MVPNFKHFILQTYKSMDSWSNGKGICKAIGNFNWSQLTTNEKLDSFDKCNYDINHF